MKRVCSFLFCHVFLLLCCYPFAWMVLSSFKQNTELFDPNQFLPREWDFFAWKTLLAGELIDWKQGLWNSLVLSLGQTFLSALLGFAYAYMLYFTRGVLRFVLTVLAIAAVVMPAQVMAIPLVEVSRNIGLYDHKWVVVLTGASSGLGALYFTQAFKRIPQTLLDAAAMDGAGHRSVFVLFFHETKGHVMGFLLLFFILCWHAHLLPLLLLHSQENLPLPLAMRSLLDSSLRFPRAVLMAASVFLILPPLTFFIMGYHALKGSLGEVLSDLDS